MARMNDRGNRSKAKKITIPGMAGVEGRTLLAEGEYEVSVEEVTMEEGSQAPYLKWKFKTDGGTLYYNTSLAPQALWNLKGLLEALGADIPDDDTDMDPEDFVDMSCMVNVEHDTYDGKKQAKIVDFWPVEVSKAKAAVDKANKKSASKDDEDEKPKGKKLAHESKADDGDEDEKPARDRNARRRDRRAAKKEVEKVQQDDIADMSEDDLLDLAEKHELEIDFDDMPSLRKKRNAVVDALEEKGLLAD